PGLRRRWVPDQGRGEDGHGAGAARKRPLVVCVLGAGREPAGRRRRRDRARRLRGRGRGAGRARDLLRVLRRREQGPLTPRAAALGRELDELVADELRDGIDARPGAREVVDALAGRRRLGVASNSTRAWVDAVLAASGLADRFEVVVTAEEVAEPKPAPDVYL